MESTPATVLETFERNRQAVRDLLHFDEIVLNLVTHHLEGLNERLKQYFRRESTDPSVKVNPKYTADNLLRLVANIRKNDSLGGQYRAMHNQCLVLLVSFFSSSTRALFRAFVAQELQSSKTELFSEKLQFTVGDLYSDEAPFSELVADALEQSKSISFQDMKGIGRGFQIVLRKPSKHDELVNDIIVAQAYRHAIVHADSRVDERLLKQIATAEPRQLKTSVTIGAEISFSEEEIESAGSSMYKYLLNVINFAEERRSPLESNGDGTAS